MSSRRGLLLLSAALLCSTLACRTLLGDGSPGFSLEDAKPTRQPTPTPLPLSTRLSGEDLPELSFGPPSDSPRDRGRPRLSGPAQALDTEHFRVHYTLEGEDAVPADDENGDGNPDYVEEVGRALEYSWFAAIEHFGWAAPPPDNDLGGDDRYDVYLQNIMDEEYAGYTDTDGDNSVIGDNPNTPDLIEDASTHSHIVLDNDYREYGESPSPGISVLDYMRSTAAHEFNHAVQFGYDGTEPHDWVWEATATWMEEESFDSINEVRGTLEAVFKSPDSCQLSEGGEDRWEDVDHWYGMWIFIRYLSEHYGHEAVLRLWELIASHDGYAAWDALMDENHTTFEDLFRDYSVALLTRDFEEGLSYPVVRLEGRTGVGQTFVPQDGVQQLGADYIEIEANGPITVSLSAENLTGVVVGFRKDQSLVYPLWANQVSMDGSQHERSYLIVMNLQRAKGEATCQFTPYQVRVESGGSPESPAWQLPAPHFVSPRVEGLQSLDE